MSALPDQTYMQHSLINPTGYSFAQQVLPYNSMTLVPWHNSPTALVGPHMPFTYSPASMLGRSSSRFMDWPSEWCCGFSMRSGLASILPQSRWSSYMYGDKQSLDESLIRKLTQCTSIIWSISPTTKHHLLRCPTQNNSFWSNPLCIQAPTVLYALHPSATAMVHWPRSIKSHQHQPWQSFSSHFGLPAVAHTKSWFLEWWVEWVRSG